MSEFDEAAEVARARDLARLREAMTWERARKRARVALLEAWLAAESGEWDAESGDPMEWASDEWAAGSRGVARATSGPTEREIRLGMAADVVTAFELVALLDESERAESLIAGSLERSRLLLGDDTAPEKRIAPVPGRPGERLRVRVVGVDGDGPDRFLVEAETSGRRTFVCRLRRSVDADGNPRYEVA